MTRSPLTRFALALTFAGTLAGSSWDAPTGAQAQTSAAPLIAAGRLALPLAAFGAGARIDHQHIDRTAGAIDHDNTLSTQEDNSHQGRRYTLFGGSGTLFQHAFLPSENGAGLRGVWYMATTFPTTGAAREVYNRDTAFLSTTFDNCSRPDLTAVGGRYSTRSCQNHSGKHAASYMLVTGVQGNVALAFMVISANDRAGTPVQLQRDSSTVARAAFASYRFLPVRRGPAPYFAPTAPVVPATSTPRPAPTSTPIPVPPTAIPVPATPVPVTQYSGPYQVSVSGASVSVSSSSPKTYSDGSTTYSYKVHYADGTQGFYLVNADNPDVESAQQASADYLTEARKPYFGGTPKVYTSGSAWLVVESGTTLCSASMGAAVNTAAFGVSVTNADCAVAVAHAKTLSYSVIDAL